MRGPRVRVGRASLSLELADGSVDALAPLTGIDSQAASASFAGVDIIAGFDGLRVIEVNSTPAWAGLQSVVDFDISAAVAADILAMAALREGPAT